MSIASEQGSADLLYGVPAIARFLGLTDRQARHLADTNAIPTFRLNKLICARRETVRAWIIEQEAAARTKHTAKA